MSLHKASGERAYSKDGQIFANATSPMDSGNFGRDMKISNISTDVKSASPVTAAVRTCTTTRLMLEVQLTVTNGTPATIHILY